MHRFSVLPICVLAALGSVAWSPVPPWLTVSVAEAQHRELFKLTAMALVEMHQASEDTRAQRVALGFPSASAGPLGPRLGETLVACFQKSAADNHNDQQDSLFEADDQFWASANRTLQRIKHEWDALGPFAKWQTNHMFGRSAFQDDVVDRMRRFPKKTRQCLEDAWQTHKATIGTGRVFDLAQDPIVSHHLERIGIDRSASVHALKLMPLPVAMDAISDAILYTTNKHVLAFLPLKDDHQVYVTPAVAHLVKQALFLHVLTDPCALAHLQRASCAIAQEPWYQEKRAQCTQSDRNCASPQDILLRVLTSAIVGQKDYDPLTAQSQVRAALHTTLHAVDSPAFTMAGLLLSLERQWCHRQDATWDAVCYQPNPFSSSQVSLEFTSF